MVAADSKPDIVIRRWIDIAAKERLAPLIDEIFFESSLTKSFAGESERRSFRERWLGRYLANDPQYAYVAMCGDDVVGYLAGRVTDADPLRAGEDIARFPDAASLARQYPAHLHINLAASFRGRGIGALLIDAFARDARRAGAAGIHVVTGAASRNVGFYKRNGFRELRRASGKAHDVVLLGRRLGGEQTA
jgi:GNAT superfamily N-acetyltransferase